MPLAPRKVTIQRAHRSGLETKVASQLSAHGVEGVYETVVIRFVRPEAKARYTPDFPLPNGIVVETKGRFLSDDRQKHKHIKAQHPNLDIRFVFSNAKARLNKKSNTTYADWCEQYGFQWADKWIPETWINEPPCAVRLASAARSSSMRCSSSFWRLNSACCARKALCSSFMRLRSAAA